MALQLNCYLLLDGSAEEAIQFYEQTLGAKLLFKQPAADRPESLQSGLSEADKQRIDHAVLLIGESKVFIADDLPGQKYDRGNQVSICLTTDHKQQSEQLFDALKQGGGKVNIELEPTYFSAAYGMVTDRFGITFQIFTGR